MRLQFLPPPPSPDLRRLLVFDHLAHLLLQLVDHGLVDGRLAPEARLAETAQALASEVLQS